MCNQAVCLIAAELERHGIATVALSLLREVAEAVRPPRALFMPYKHGYPLGEPENVELQLSVMRQALAMFDEPAGPVLMDFVDTRERP